MRLRISFAGIAFLVVAGLAGLTLTGSGDPQAQEFEYATRIRPAALDDAELAKALDTAKVAGITSIDVEVVWHEIDQGTLSGETRTYDWSSIDRLLQGAEARGMQVTLLLTQTPDWVHPELKQTEPSWSARVWTPPKGDTELLHWSNFVHDVVERYEGRVAHYEIWNEPNHPFFWRPEPDPAGYAALLRAAYLSAKEADPEATVVFGGLSRNDLGYLGEFYRVVKTSYPDAASQSYYFDVLDVHPYSSDRSPDQYLESKVDPGPYGEVDGNFLGFTRMKQLMEEQGDPGKPLFLGEYGFSSDPDSWQFVPDDRRGLYLKRAYELAREKPYVEGLSWYAYHPNPSDKPEWAILKEDLSPTRTYRAYSQVTGAVVPSSPKRITIVLPKSVSGTYSIVPEIANLSYDNIRRWELYVDGALVRQQYNAKAPIEWGSRGVEDGTHKVMVAAYTSGSVWRSNIAETYTENSAPLAPVITEPPDGAYNNTGNVTLSGTAEAGSTVEVFEDGASRGVTAAGATGKWSKALTGVDEGSHTYAARATDKAGNASPVSAAISITVDTVAPETTIDDGPSGTTDSRTAVFAFSSETDATFGCSLDGGPFTACSSPKDYSGLADGEHNFRVRATDRAGNVDASPAERGFSVDTTRITTFTSVADTRIVESTPTSTFGVSSTVQVSGDYPDGTGQDNSGLLRWDLSAVPVGAKVSSASVTLDVTNASSQAYEVYSLKRPWTEPAASWNLFATSRPWEVAGAKGSLDRDASVAGSAELAATGEGSFELSPEVAQGWVDDPASNRGIVIADETNTDGLTFYSRDAADAARGPELTLTYTAP